MDQRLKDALEYSNYRLTLATHKKNIILRAEAIQLVSNSGGMFRATEQLILWIDYLVRAGHDQYVVVDMNEQPILVQQLPKLKDQLSDAHAKSMNLLHSESEKIKRVRNVQKIVEAPNESTGPDTVEA